MVDKKWGYVDMTGQIVIEPQFDYAAGFTSEGLALVSEGGEYGYIDKTGKFVISPQFQRAESFSEGLALVLFSDGTTGYIDTTGGRTAITLPNDASSADSFSEGLAAVTYRNGTTGYIDKTGNIVSAPRKYISMGGSDAGLICVALQTNQKWGCMDKTGQFVIPAQFDFVGVYQGLVNVTIGNKSGWMDTTGNYVW